MRNIYLILKYNLYNNMKFTGNQIYFKLTENEINKHTHAER